jgi:type VI secretion system protein ImpG
VRDELLNYYERELAYLRQSGAEFAASYPKIASRLLLEPNRCEDPHVERLLEAFAFLAARVHLKLDDEYSEFTQSLFSVLYPHFVRPLPSMTVAEFHLDTERGGVTSALDVPRGATVFSKSAGGLRLRFRTGMDLSLWPFRVQNVRWAAPESLDLGARDPRIASVLRVELRCGHGASFQDIPLRALRFFLNGEAGVVFPLYEMLAGRCRRILLRDPAGGPGKRTVELSSTSLRPCGFAPEEALLPYPRRSFDGYRLLQEYFAFPEKFLFFELSGLDAAAATGAEGTLEILFLCTDPERADWGPILELGVNDRTLRLGCTTLVNLFEHTAEPVRVDGTRYEMRVTPDARRHDAFEIYSVEEVVGTNAQSGEVTPFEPFFAIKHRPSGPAGTLFWHATRRAARGTLDPATEIDLSIADLSGKPQLPPVETLTVRCLCTNRELPSRMPFGDENGDFELESLLPVSRITALRKPTHPARPLLGGAELLQLLSHLSLSYLSLVEEGRDSLCEMLRLYVPANGFGDRQVEGIAKVSSRRHFARVGSDYGVSFVRGIQVDLELDEDYFVGAGAYLFASVLDRFLGLFVNLNSFSQLAVRSRQRKGLLAQWPPRSGQGILV